MKIEIDKDWVSITCDNCGEIYNFSHKLIREGRAKMCSRCSVVYDTKQMKKLLTTYGGLFDKIKKIIHS